MFLLVTCPSTSMLACDSGHMCICILTVVFVRVDIIKLCFHGFCCCICKPFFETAKLFAVHMTQLHRKWNYVPSYTFVHRSEIPTVYRA